MKMGIQIFLLTLDSRFRGNDNIEDCDRFTTHVTGVTYNHTSGLMFKP